MLLCICLVSCCFFDTENPLKSININYKTIYFIDLIFNIINLHLKQFQMIIIAFIKQFQI